jgi:hypothetical protein
MWAEIRLCYSWVHQAAHILKNEEDLPIEELRRDYRRLLCEMSARKEEAGTLWGAESLFLKVSRSYWKGLFRCYRFPDLPRTNNELEHHFGSVRYGERRASGRKGASPAMVVRGCSVRVVGAVVTPPEGFAAADTYARGTSKNGEPCALRWRSGERPAAPSCGSGGTRPPTSADSKSNYSSRLCHPSFFSPYLT